MAFDSLPAHLQLKDRGRKGPSRGFRKRRERFFGRARNPLPHLPDNFWGSRKRISPWSHQRHPHGETGSRRRFIMLWCADWFAGRDFALAPIVLGIVVHLRDEARAEAIGAPRAIPCDGPEGRKIACQRRFHVRKWCPAKAPCTPADYQMRRGSCSRFCAVSGKSLGI